MIYTGKSHPTRYAGVRFRSRLEARWAAFFDLMAWPWSYEPVDLDGWSPDFAVALPGAVLVEVKPIVWFGTAAAALAVSADIRAKMGAAPGAVLLLGSTPIWETAEDPALGLIRREGWAPLEVPLPRTELATLWGQANATTQYRKPREC